jgi:transcriptional regulator with XRE-family HTH domain
MSRKINYKSVSPFHDRLFELMKDDVDMWAEKIGVSASLIRDKWFKGSFPGADKLMKICEVSGKSASWILFGEIKEGGEAAVYPYKERNRHFHDQAEVVLISDDNRLIDLLRASLEGVLGYMTRKQKKDQLIEMLIETNLRLTKSLDNAEEKAAASALSDRFKLLTDGES